MIRKLLQKGPKAETTFKDKRNEEMNQKAARQQIKIQGYKKKLDLLRLRAS
jgi:hypothetical protein